MLGTKVPDMADVFDFRDHLGKRHRRPSLSARDLAIGLTGMAATAAAVLFWPPSFVGLPLVPAVSLFLAATLLAGTHERWRPRLRDRSGGRRGV